jgi:hypothetical protein
MEMGHLEVVRLLLDASMADEVQPPARPRSPVRRLLYIDQNLATQNASLHSTTMESPDLGYQRGVL